MGKRGVLLIISGPSGSGKGTIVRELLKQQDYALSISVTTRAPRVGEEEGVHYFFRTREAFESLRDSGELLEWAEFLGSYYGTPRSYVKEQLALGKNVILEIDVQGAFIVKESFPDCILIFIVPPTLKELRNRLESRGTETTDVIARRIERARAEIKLIDAYDYLVINDSIFKATQDIIYIVSGERLKVSRNELLKQKLKGDVF